MISYIRKLVFIVGLVSAILFFAGDNRLFAQPFYSTNINDVYQSIGFNPAASNSGVLIQITDIHMAASPGLMVDDMIITNLDPRLVSMIKAIRPLPTGMIVTGDLCTSGGVAFGVRDYEPAASNELTWARTALMQFTNFPLYIIPGNHDNPAYETNSSPLFNSIFPEYRRYTNFTIAGLPILAMGGHGGGWLDPEERAWLTGLRQKLNHNQPVLLAIHQPISPIGGTDGREAWRDVSWFFKPWTAPVYLMSGHAHYRSADQYQMGTTTLTTYVCPAAQNWLIPTVDPFSPSACAFFVWCITNGNVAGVIEGSLTNQSYYAVGPDIHNNPSVGFASLMTNVLFYAEEGHFNDADYNVTIYGGYDVTYWRSYVGYYIAQLPISKYPQATKLLISANHDDPNHHFFLGPDTNHFTEIAYDFSSNGLYTIPIPLNLRTNPLWFKMSNTVDTIVGFGGFGLTTTNPISDFSSWKGEMLYDSTLPDSTVLTNAGNISAWQAYLYGLDTLHVETMTEVAGAPFLGTQPYVSASEFRFGARTNLPYSVLFATNLNSPPVILSNFTPTITTNGWSEFAITNHTRQGFFRIGASQ